MYDKYYQLTKLGNAVIVTVIGALVITLLYITWYISPLNTALRIDELDNRIYQLERSANSLKSKQQPIPADIISKKSDKR